jgi:hypothetical protein
LFRYFNLERARRNGPGAFHGRDDAAQKYRRLREQNVEPRALRKVAADFSAGEAARGIIALIHENRAVTAE